jgi:hypothetical protein
MQGRMIIETISNQSLYRMLQHNNWRNPRCRDRSEKVTVQLIKNESSSYVIRRFIIDFTCHYPLQCVTVEITEYVLNLMILTIHLSYTLAYKGVWRLSKTHFYHSFGSTKSFQVLRCDNRVLGWDSNDIQSFLLKEERCLIAEIVCCN